MSKKPKTPDVAAVWHEVKGISNGLAALRITVACNQNETVKHCKHIGDAFDRIAALEDPKVDINALAQQVGDIQSEVDNLQPLHAAVSMLEAKVGQLCNDLHEVSGRLDKANDHIGAIISRLDDIKPLPKLETIKCVGGSVQVRSQSGAMLDQARANHADSVFNYTQATNRRLDSVQSVVTVLVIVQAFTIIAGLAWVLGVGK